MLGSGLRGTLVRTKTTGAGKHKEELEVVVDKSAFVLVPGWLSAGWVLWDGVFPERDFFFGFPTPSRDGMLCMEASYADDTAMSHA